MGSDVVDERVGVELMHVANKIGASFGAISAKITAISDRYVSTATDIRREAADWFELPPKISSHIDRAIRSVLRVEKLLEVLVSFLWVLTFIIIMKFVLEAIFETIDVCVFCNRRPRRLFPYVVNRVRSNTGMSSLKRTAKEDDTAGAKNAKYDEEIQLKLFDLPQEILIKIVEQPIITLEDRMIIRTTCKAATSIVSQSIFKRDELMIETFDRVTDSVTRVSGLFVPWLPNNERNVVCIREGRNIAFTNLMLKLFRRAHFNKIKIIKFNFDPNAPRQRMGINQLQPLAESLICEELRIDGRFHLRMIDIVNTMDIRHHLVLELWGLPTDSQYLLRLSPINKLTIISRAVDIEDEILMGHVEEELLPRRDRFPAVRRGPLTVDDSNVLALVTKHRHLSLCQDKHINRESLDEAIKVIADSGHCLDVILPRRMIKDLLVSLGVYVNGQNLACASSAVKMSTKTSRARTTYTVEVDRTQHIFAISRGETLDTNNKLKITIKSINF